MSNIILMHFPANCSEGQYFSIETLNCEPCPNGYFKAPGENVCSFCPQHNNASICQTGAGELTYKQISVINHIQVLINHSENFFLGIT